MLLVPQITRRSDAHFVEGEFTRRVIHYAHLLTFVVVCILVCHHVNFVTSHVILASERLGFVHLLISTVLANAQLVAVRGHGVAGSRRIGKRWHSVVVGFGIDLHRMLLLLSFAVILGGGFGAVGAIYLS